MPEEIVTPHLAYPMQLQGSSFQVVEQDLIDDVRQSVFLIARTQIGARPLAPTIGIEDPTFAQIDPDELAAQLEDLEPRAVVQIALTPVDETGRQDVLIAVSLASEGQPSGDLPTPLAGPLPETPVDAVDGGWPWDLAELSIDGGDMPDGWTDSLDGGTL